MLGKHSTTELHPQLKNIHFNELATWVPYEV
jgi:hypothetical protein